MYSTVVVERLRNEPSGLFYILMVLRRSRFDLIFTVYIQPMDRFSASPIQAPRARIGKATTSTRRKRLRTLGCLSHCKLLYDGVPHSPFDNHTGPFTAVGRATMFNVFHQALEGRDGRPYHHTLRTVFYCISSDRRMKTVSAVQCHTVRGTFPKTARSGAQDMRCYGTVVHSAGKNRVLSVNVDVSTIERVPTRRPGDDITMRYCTVSDYR